MRSLGLTAQILLAIVLGGLTGALINNLAAADSWWHSIFVGEVLSTGGKLFVSSLKMMVVPLVFISLVAGVSALGDTAKLGRIGGKTIALYLLTTALAISIALSIGIATIPDASPDQALASDFTPKSRPSLSEVIANLIPSNPIAAMAEGNMLQIIVFAIVIGLGILRAGEAGQDIKQFFDKANAVVLEVVMLLMRIAPLGVFCLIAKTFSSEGLDLIIKLGGHFFTVLLALAAHAVLSYSLLLKLMTGLSPLHFFKQMVPALTFAFSTASSNATIPVTLRVVKERLGVDNSVASFSVPLGATINMDGTAIMQGVATVFIAGIYGVDLSLSDYLVVIATATLASIGTAGVPGVGLITLAMVLHQVNLPVEGIALIIGVDRLLDMARTAVNITGDATVSCIVAHSEGVLDKIVFNAEPSSLEQQKSITDQ